MIINRAIRQMSGFVYERRESAGEMNRSRWKEKGRRGNGGVVVVVAGSKQRIRASSTYEARDL
jgi:hypothetical protein